MQDCNFPPSFNKSSDDLTFWFHIFPSFYCKDFKWKIFSLLHTQCYFLLPFNDLNERPSLVAARVGVWCPWGVFGVMFGVLGVALGQGLVSLGWLWVPVWSWGGFGLGFGGFGSEFGVSGVTLGSLLFLGWLWVSAGCFWGCFGSVFLTCLRYQAEKLEPPGSFQHPWSSPNALFGEAGMVLFLPV